MKKMNYTYDEFRQDVPALLKLIYDMAAKKGMLFTGVYGIPKGGIPLAMELSDLMGVPLVTDSSQLTAETLVVDDIIDSGATRRRFPVSLVASLFRKANSPTFHPDETISLKELPSECWITFWWEGSEEVSILDAPVRMMQYIGEDVNREGLRETPARVIRAWNELYSGYQQKPEEVLKVFSEDSSDEMVLIKNVEFYSTCEHHLLPFFGKAHIAYLPNKRVVGVSKLARLLDVYAKRLQIQERLCQQVTTALMTHLQPLGAACIIEATHFCMTARGVRKQHSEMVTSSLVGSFREDARARQELLMLIQGGK